MLKENSANCKVDYSSNLFTDEEAGRGNFVKAAVTVSVLEGEYDTQERKLLDLTDELAELNKRMNEYIPYIEQKATYYRECQN